MRFHQPLVAIRLRCWACDGGPGRGEATSSYVPVTNGILAASGTGRAARRRPGRDRHGSGRCRSPGPCRCSAEGDRLAAGEAREPRLDGVVADVRSVISTAASQGAIPLGGTNSIVARSPMLGVGGPDRTGGGGRDGAVGVAAAASPRRRPRLAPPAKTSLLTLAARPPDRPGARPARPAGIMARASRPRLSGTPVGQRREPRRRRRRR